MTGEREKHGGRAALFLTLFGAFTLYLPAAFLVRDLWFLIWYAGLLFVLSLIGYRDALTGKITKRRCLLLTLAAAPSLFFFPEITVGERVTALFLTALTLFLSAGAAERIFHLERPLGGGDIRMILSLSLLLGSRVMDMLLLSCVLEAMYLLILAVVKRRSLRDLSRKRIAFGPFLSLSAAFSAFSLSVSLTTEAGNGIFF